jgi:hypothetical protein
MPTIPSLAPNTRRQLGLGTDMLWLIIILAGFLFFTSLIPLPPNDFWWHLKIGEWIWMHKAIPTTNMYAWTLPADHVYYYGTWLGELILYALYRLGGIEVLAMIRTLLAGISFWLVGYEAHRRSGSWRIAAVVVALAYAMTLNNLIVRTQIWSWVPFMIFYILLARFSDRQLKPAWLLACPLIMIFWVNSHGAFILGLALVGIYFIGESIGALLKLSDTLEWKRIAWLAGTGMLSLLAILVNPRFTGIFTYVFDLMTDKPSQQLIVEWQSPTPQGIANIVFYVSILLLVMVLAYSRHKLKPTAMITILAFLWLAWSGQRYVIWFGMTMTPILALGIRRFPLKVPSLTIQRNWVNVVIAGLLLIPVIAVQPWFVESIPLPKTYWEQALKRSPEGPLLDVETPVAAVQYLKENPGGRIFNEMGYGSYMIWAIPVQGVFIDPRVELYPYEQWQDYANITHGIRCEQLLEKYNVNRVLLSKALQKELSIFLASDSNWKLEYNDSYAEIWTKQP